MAFATFLHFQLDNSFEVSTSGLGAKRQKSPI